MTHLIAKVGKEPASYPFRFSFNPHYRTVEQTTYRRAQGASSCRPLHSAYMPGSLGDGSVRVAGFLYEIVDTDFGESSFHALR